MTDAPTLARPLGAERVGPLRARFARDGLLSRIGADVRLVLGADRVQRVALYGSRARGDARDDGGIDDSDWDIVIFVWGPSPTRTEKEALRRWADTLAIESGWSVEPLLQEQDAWKRRTIFMHNLRFDMLDL